jgi:hypothetical protein
MEKSFEFEHLGENRKREVFFNPNGLSEEEQKLVESIGTEVIEGSKAKFKYALNRCTFFAEPGLKVLEEVVIRKPEVTNPEIRGCDKNLFDQHYWVEFTFKQGSRKVVIDPIFEYVGLLDKSSGTDGSAYYRHSRHVIPNKHVSEGGVRINTNGVM